MYHNPTFLDSGTLACMTLSKKPLQQTVRKGMVNISQQIAPHYFQPHVHREHVKVAFHIHPFSMSLVFFVGNEVTLLVISCMDKTNSLKHS